MKNIKQYYHLLQFRGRKPEMYHPNTYEERKIDANLQKKNAFPDSVIDGEYYIYKAIEKTNYFLDELGIDRGNFSDAFSLLPIYPISKNQVMKSKKVRIDYGAIQEEMMLNNQNHLVWMKFAKEKRSNKRYLGVVAASDDVNFSMNNTSGNIIKDLKLEWDESFVLLFPLPGITDGMRKDIECGIGNYLIECGIPILDFYSHRYQ